VVETCQAPAKVTLALDVGPRREDGWHPVDLVLQRIGLKDQLTIVPWANPEVPRTPTVTVSGQNLTEDTLVAHALKLAAEVVGHTLPIDVHIAKAVPVGAGLGGGSADAAAILRWAIQQHPDRQAALLALAAVVGSDVVFSVQPHPLCRATGRGDVLEPVVSPSRFWLVVAHPGFPTATAAVYHAFDTVGSRQPPMAAVVMDALVSGVVPSAIGNQLEEAAVVVNPDLASFRAQLLRFAPKSRMAMTGSGSAFVAVAEKRAEAERIARRWRGAGAPFVWWGEAVPSDGSGAGGAA